MSLQIFDSQLTFTKNTSKKEIVSKFTDLANKAAESDESVLEMDAYIRKIEFAIKTFKDNPNYKEALISEVKPFGEPFMKDGVLYEVAAAGTTYDYSSDDIWSELKEEITARETILKQYSGSSFMEERTDTETGEVTQVRVFGAVKKSGETVRGTIK